LSVQVTNIDRVHIDNMNILEARKREVGKNLTPQPPGANDEDFAAFPQEFLHLDVCVLRNASSVRGPGLSSI